MSSLPAFALGAWSPGIGDPSFMGWLTVFSYYFVACLCAVKTILLSGGRRHRLLWAVIACVMAALGVIKQFNLLGAATEAARVFARSGGWIGDRRVVQACLMGALLVFFLFAVQVLRSLTLPVVARFRSAVLGLGYLLFFVVMRAISWHPLEEILGYDIEGFRINWLAELTGICWVAAACLMRSGPGPEKERQS